MTTVLPSWPLASGANPLEAQAVHLWAICLNEVAGSRSHADPLLSPDERERAGRFLFDYLRSRFVAGRTALRVILADYLGADPQQIAFAYDRFGKPSLDPKLHKDHLHFNFTHSGDLAVLALTRGCEIGVDLERHREVKHAEGIAGRYFHPHEAAAVLAVEQRARERAFFSCWTKKEAVIKAIGAGLQFPLQDFCVSVLSDRPCWVKIPESKYSAAGRCWLQAFQPCHGYSGAVATLSACTDCRFHTFARRATA